MLHDNVHRKVTTSILTVGLMKPIGFLPIAIRASLTAVSMAPMTGEEAEVPKTILKEPATLMI